MATDNPNDTIAGRANKAQAAAKALLASRKANHAPAPRAAKTTPRPAPATQAQPQPTPRNPEKTKHLPLTAKKKPGRPPGKGKNAALVSQIFIQRLSPLQRIGVVSALRHLTQRPAGLAALEDDVVFAVEAVIAGSRVPGRVGASDRLILFKLAGLPLGLVGGGAQNVGSGAGASTASAIRDMGSRLERAISLSQSGKSPGFGRVPATLDMDEDGELLSRSDNLGHPHEIGQLMRVADAPDPAAEPVTLPRPREIELAEELPDWMADE